jgi:hypothetical protein
MNNPDPLLQRMCLRNIGLRKLEQVPPLVRNLHWFLRDQAGMDTGSENR